MSSLRVVTLNTWKGEGAYSSRLAAMAAGLEALGADLVALQEVFTAPSLCMDTGAYLAAALGMQAAILPLRHKLRRVQGSVAESASGLALLSRLPPLSQRAIALSSHPDDGERLALAAELDLGGYRVSVVVLHLTHLVNADDLRRRQLAQALAAADTPTAILAGDFNAPIETFRLGTTRFADCRTTLHKPAQPTLVAAADERCIDHVLFARDGCLRAHNWQVAMNIRDPQGMVPSDHCAVVADFIVDARRFDGGTSNESDMFPG